MSFGCTKAINYSCEHYNFKRFLFTPYLCSLSIHLLTIHHSVLSFKPESPALVPSDEVQLV